MTWTIKFDDRAAKELRKLDRQVQKDILNYLRKRIATKEDPRRFGKPHSGDKAGLWRYRVGDYRIIRTIEDNNLIVAASRERRKIYDDQASGWGKPIK